MAADKSKTFPIRVSNGILTAEHYQKIGDAIWYFLWCIDRTTKEVVDDAGNVYGIVLGGMQIRDTDVASTFGVHINTARTWRRNLSDGHYIKTTRTPNGCSIKVLKSKKFGKRTTENCYPQKTVTPSDPQKTVIVHSLSVDPQNFAVDSQKTVDAIRQCSDSAVTIQDRLTDSGAKTDSEKPAVSEDIRTLSEMFYKNTGRWFEISGQTEKRLLAAVEKHGIEDMTFAMDGFTVDDHNWSKVKRPAVLFLSQLDSNLPCSPEGEPKLADIAEPMLLEDIEAPTV